jgi:hypothetical protein
LLVTILIIMVFAGEVRQGLHWSWHAVFPRQTSLFCRLWKVS